MTDSSLEPSEVEQPRTRADRLLAPLSEAQQWVVDIIGQAFWDGDFTWPTFLYVEAEMDKRGHDLRETLATFPMIAGIRSQSYSAIVSVQHTASINESSELKLSLLGLWHCDGKLRPFARDAVTDVISVLNMCISTRRNWNPVPTETKMPELTSDAVLANLPQRLFDGNEAHRSSGDWARLL